MKDSISKTELINVVAEETEVSKKMTREVIDAALEKIKATLRDGKSVRMVGFGTFELRHRSAKTSRNPRTGEPVQVPAHDVVAFKAGKDLKESVR